VADAGAAGIVQIWPSGEDALHEDTVGTVWGTPTFDTARFLIDIPVVSVKRKDGKALEEKLGGGRMTARLRSEVSTGVRKVSFPVASIPGKTEDFVLLSGHYDTWYDGIIDNGTSNAACLEIARVLWENRGTLLRGVKIAWWAGHSNGRYMGSAWYCDASGTRCTSTASPMSTRTA
jgi:aminopeptidase YwaD